MERAQTAGSQVLARLRSRLLGAVDEPLLNKVQRWAAASIAIAFAVACAVFGAVYSWTPSMVLAARESFAFFWMALGVAIFVSTFGIAKWLGEREG